MTTFQDDVAELRRCLQQHQPCGHLITRVLGDPTTTVTMPPYRPRPLTAAEAEKLAATRRFLGDPMQGVGFSTTPKP